MPETVEALMGSCVLIPCTFTVTKSATGKELNTDGRVNASWLEDASEQNIFGKTVYNSITNKTTGFSRIQICGNLSLKNCTTIFYNVKTTHAKQYHFRANTSDFQATFLDRPFKLSILGEPHEFQFNCLSKFSLNVSLPLQNKSQLCICILWQILQGLHRYLRCLRCQRGHQ